MQIFNFDDFVANLPDAFYKDKESNNYKLLEVERHIYYAINAMLQSVYNILDIDNAKGAVLDDYGERLGLRRGSADDTQYLLRLKSKISQSLSDGTRNGVANALAYCLSTSTDKIKLKSGEETGTVCIIDIPIDLLTEAGFSSEQIVEMVEGMLPQGVRVLTAEFSGTFEFAETENEYDENSGFADADGKIGGYFGMISA